VTTETARELLANNHLFPGEYTIKAIGSPEDDFVARIVSAAEEGLGRPSDVHHSTRLSAQGNHVAVTLELTVLTPDEVIAVYQALQVIKGLRFLL
jgi:hypothetical protein